MEVVVGGGMRTPKSECVYWEDHILQRNGSKAQANEIYFSNKISFLLFNLKLLINESLPTDH